MVDEMTPNQASQKEKAEGSRENVNLGTGADNPAERGSGQESDQPATKHRDDAGGISNRPLSEEEQRDAQLPPRGKAKKGGHAS